MQPGRERAVEIRGRKGSGKEGGEEEREERGEEGGICGLVRKPNLKTLFWRAGRRAKRGLIADIPVTPVLPSPRACMVAGSWSCVTLPREGGKKGGERNEVRKEGSADWPAIPNFKPCFGGQVGGRSGGSSRTYPSPRFHGGRGPASRPGAGAALYCLGKEKGRGEERGEEEEACGLTRKPNLEPRFGPVGRRGGDIADVPVTSVPPSWRSHMVAGSWSCVMSP